MSADPRKRQKKLQRLKAKRQEKKHHHAREQSAGLAERLAAAARYPVLNAWVAEDLWTTGMGQATLSRALPDGSVAFAVFLVDRYCLGVKDAFGSILSRAEYESRFEQKSRSQFAVRERLARHGAEAGRRGCRLCGLPGALSPQRLPQGKAHLRLD